MSSSCNIYLIWIPCQNTRAIQTNTFRDRDIVIYRKEMTTVVLTILSSHRA